MEEERVTKREGEGWREGCRERKGGGNREKEGWRKKVTERERDRGRYAKRSREE